MMRHFDDGIFLGNGEYSTARVKLLHTLVDRAVNGLNAVQQGAFDLPKHSHLEIDALLDDIALDIATAITGKYVTIGRRIPRNRRSKIYHEYVDAKTKQPVEFTQSGFWGPPLEIVSKDEVYEAANAGFEENRNER